MGGVPDVLWELTRGRGHDVPLNSWLGLVVGIALYAASRRYAPREECSLAEAFGADWDAHTESVAFPWL